MNESTRLASAEPLPALAECENQCAVRELIRAGNIGKTIVDVLNVCTPHLGVISTALRAALPAQKKLDVINRVLVAWHAGSRQHTEELHCRWWHRPAREISMWPPVLDRSQVGAVSPLPSSG